MHRVLPASRRSADGQKSEDLEDPVHVGRRARGGRRYSSLTRSSSWWASSDFAQTRQEHCNDPNSGRRGRGQRPAPFLERPRAGSTRRSITVADHRQSREPWRSRVRWLAVAPPGGKDREAGMPPASRPKTECQQVRPRARRRIRLRRRAPHPPGAGRSGRLTALDRGDPAPGCSRTPASRPRRRCRSQRLRN